MPTRVVLYPSQLQSLLRGPAGPVARDLARRAVRVESQAKVNASGRPGPNVQTGRLRSSIHWRLATDDRHGIVAQVIANTEYARYVELGTDRAPAYPYLRPALRAAR
jgi:hypothetical protein